MENPSCSRQFTDVAADARCGADRRRPGLRRFVDATRLLGPRAACLWFAAVLASGCAGLGDPGDGGEPVTQTLSALGEIGCETAVKDDDVTSIPLCGLGASTSTNTTYGTSACPDQWLVGFGGYTDGDIAARIDWADPMPSNEGACIRSHLAMGAYVESGGVWNRSTTRRHGVWSGTSCSFQPDDGPVDLGLGSGSHHRLAGSATTQSPIFDTNGVLLGFLTVKHKVRVALYHTGSCVP